MIQNKTIVFISTMNFSDLPTRKQRIAQELSKTNRVIFFEPPITYLAKWFRKAKKKKLNFSEESPNLFVDTFPTILPFGLRFTFFHRCNEKKIIQYLKKSFRVHGFTPDLFWFYLVDYPGIATLYPTCTIVYDCVDDHTAYGGLRSPHFVQQLEKKLVAESQVVFTTTHELATILKEYKSNPLVVPNGVEYDLFANWDGEKPSLLRTEKRPIIGYLGALQSWFDSSFVKKAAAAYENCIFVIAGPCTASFRREFELCPNVLFPGPIPYSEVPSWIGSFQVCLIPFLQNDLTLRISPLKFFEYCAMGKPCVSIPIYQLEPYQSFTYFYHDEEEGIRKIQEALIENDSHQEDRKNVAFHASWQNKFEYMFQQVEQKLTF